MLIGHEIDVRGSGEWRNRRSPFAHFDKGGARTPQSEKSMRAFWEAFPLGQFGSGQGYATFVGFRSGPAVGLDAMKVLTQQFKLSERRYAERGKVATRQPKTDKFFSMFIGDVGDLALNFGHHFQRAQLGGRHRDERRYMGERHI